jgi:peptidoglycan/xylan/chitin deacetylase (PgdA/CDA1 family)
MLNFKTVSFLFLIECALIGILNYFFGISLWWLILPIIVYKTFIIYGSAKIESNFYTKTICCSSTNEKQIAITFDDGPNAEYTNKALSLLTEFNAPATFFVIGKNILGNENIIRKIDAAGHIIGNHTFSHSFFIDFKSTTGFSYELDATSDILFNIIHKRPKLFRPPYGVTTPNLAKASKALNYDLIGWNIRSMDTTNESEEKITQRVISQIKPGAILLFHDASEKTIQVLKQTLNFAKENGFKIVGLEELLQIKAYH